MQNLEKRSEQGNLDEEEEAPVGDYDDPTAVLTGEWGPNQHGKATAHVENPTDEWFQEVQIRLRRTLEPHSISGYEIFFRCLKGDLGYAEIVRWNGAVGDWTSLQRQEGPEFGVGHGDVIEATIEGNVITGYINGEAKITATDDTWKSRRPGRRLQLRRRRHLRRPRPVGLPRRHLRVGCPRGARRRRGELAGGPPKLGAARGR